MHCFNRIIYNIGLLEMLHKIVWTHLLIIDI